MYQKLQTWITDSVWCMYGQRVTNMRSADDIDLVAESQDQLHEFTDRVNETSKRFQLKRYNDCSDGRTQDVITMKLDNEELQQVDEFV